MIIPITKTIGAPIKETFSGEMSDINVEMCKKGYEKTRTMDFQGERE